MKDAFDIMQEERERNQSLQPTTSDETYWVVETKIPSIRVFGERRFQTRREAQAYRKTTAYVHSTIADSEFTIYKVTSILYTDGSIHKIYKRAD